MRVAEPVSRFSLLPVPTTRRRNRRESDTSNTMRKKSHSISLLEDSIPDLSGQPSPSSLKLQDIISGSSSNILSAATTGSNLLSSAAKGMSFLSSATSTYLRDGEGRPKYF